MDKKNITLFVSFFISGMFSIFVLLLYFENRRINRIINNINKTNDSIYIKDIRKHINTQDSIIRHKIYDIEKQINKIEKINKKYDKKKSDYIFFSDDSLAFILREILLSTQ